jgi:hypothetical protein
MVEPRRHGAAVEAVGPTVSVDKATRVWVGREPEDPDKIKSTPIPGEIVERLSAE